MIKRPLAAGLFVLLVVGLLALAVYRSRTTENDASHEVTHLSGDTMGTRYNVRLREILSPARSAELHRSLKDTLRRINGLMSTYDPESEISRFNRLRTVEPVPVSPETAALVADSLEISRKSAGAFDVTVAPLVDAWGFGPPGRSEAPPTEEEIERLRSRVGFEKLKVRLSPPSLTKLNPLLAVDLSAIAKGYAVDELAEVLESSGFLDYMVEIGGEVRARGVSSRERPWRIGIEEPVREGRKVRAVVELSGRGLASSGNYRNSYEIDGVRYVHTLNPSSGRPVRHRLAGVSVLHPRCAIADAWATALLVTGPEKALEVAEREGLEIYLLTATPAGAFEAKATEGFTRRLLTSP